MPESPDTVPDSGAPSARAGTTASSRRSRFLPGTGANVAGIPLKSTAVAPVKFVPMSVIFAPGKHRAGKNPEPVNPGGGVGNRRSVNLPMDSAALNPVMLPATAMT